MVKSDASSNRRFNSKARPFFKKSKATYHGRMEMTTVVCLYYSHDMTMNYRKNHKELTTTFVLKLTFIYICGNNKMGQRESTDKEVHKVEKKISNSSTNVRASDGKLEKKIRATSADKSPLAKSEGASNEPNLRRSNPGSSSGSTTLSSSTSSLNLSNSSNPAPCMLTFTFS